MTRTLRSRSKDRIFKGKITDWTNGVAYITPVTVTKTSTMSDWIGAPVSDSTLTADQNKDVMIINGKMLSAYQPSAMRFTELEDYPWNPGFGSPSVAPIPAPSGWALDVRARTNPSRPVLTPPTLIQDLIELPAMLRDIPRLMKTPQTILTPKGASSAYLGTIFGWMPFVDDIRKLLDVQSLIDKRNQELTRLYSDRGLKRRLPMGESTAVGGGVDTISGQGSAVLHLPYSITVRKEAWATIRWKPTSPPPYHPGDREWNQRTRRVVLGMTTEGLAKGLWDVIPWTWLVGWFTNIGKLALANSNTIPASCSKACFMSKVTKTTTAGSPYTTGCLSDKFNVSGTMTRTYLNRTVSGSITPGFNMPFLDMSKLSILSALTIQRIKR